MEFPKVKAATTEVEEAHISGEFTVTDFDASNVFEIYISTNP